MVAHQIITRFSFVIFPQSVWRQHPDRQLSPFAKRIAALAFLFLSLIAIQAQPAPAEHPGDPNARVIEGVNNTTVFGMGQSIRITGEVKEGAIAFGGDVIVEGTVDGDVAAIGGSVVQREGSRIGGDVIVMGGIYHHGKAAPGRDPKSVTIMYAGYEDQLRQVMREPFSLLRPQLTPVFFGIRLLAILFWFIIALALTAAMPNTVSRAVARLQLTSLRVALIGLVGSIVITVGVFLALLVLPPLVGVVISHSGRAAGDRGHALWPRRDFRGDRPLASAALFSETKIRIRDPADGRYILGDNGVASLRLADSGCRIAGNQSWSCADGALSPYLEKVRDGKSLISRTRSPEEGSLLASCGRTH